MCRHQGEKKGTQRTKGPANPGLLGDPVLLKRGMGNREENGREMQDEGGKVNQLTGPC